VGSDMQVGDLVKYKNCGTHGIITKVYEFHKHSWDDYYVEVVWMDGVTSDVPAIRIEVLS